jgi:membrane-associated phospholipid phosphatase
MSEKDLTTSSPSTTSTEGTAKSDVSGVSRRRFLGSIGGAAAVAAIGAAGGIAIGTKVGQAGVEDDLAPIGDASSATAATLRRDACFKFRVDAATYNRDQPLPDHVTNGDEALYPSRIGSYSKGLPHNRYGEVDSYAWSTFMAALTSGSPAAFENIVLGGGRPLVNPQSGLAFDMEGADSHALATLLPPPTISSSEAAAEMVEHYWMALLRDTSFDDYENSPLAAAAVDDLNKLASADFKGPRENGKITAQTLFRDNFPGQAVGPYISQFMLLPTPFGAQFVDNHNRTFLPGTDHMTSYNEWLTVQNGGVLGSNVYDTTRRYLRNGRDVAAWVQNDVLFQAYFNAALILITPPNASDGQTGGFGAPLNPGNPYANSRTQAGFGTYGAPGILGLMCEMASRALKATWYQKWFVHRRLRPEAFGGLVHVQRTKNRWPGVLHANILNAPVLDRVYSKYGSYLQPQAFPEGSPTHGSFTAGHATVAGASVTILKALFDESAVIKNPVQVTPDGLAVVPYSGPELTIGGELNKLASNIATGRNLAGVHWRSDSYQSMLLGEKLAISIMRDQRAGFNESREGFYKGQTFTKFDGTKATV